LLFFHPGPSGQYADLRFTAPFSGVFTLTGDFVGVKRFPAISDDHILVNGIPVFDTAVGPFGTLFGFNVTASLAQGGTIEWWVSESIVATSVTARGLR
jgi:hypothetical protein